MAKKTNVLWNSIVVLVKIIVYAYYYYHFYVSSQLEHYICLPILGYMSVSRFESRTSLYVKHIIWTFFYWYVRCLKSRVNKCENRKIEDIQNIQKKVKRKNFNSREERFFFFFSRNSLFRGETVRKFFRGFPKVIECILRKKYHFDYFHTNHFFGKLKLDDFDNPINEFKLWINSKTIIYNYIMKIIYLREKYSQTHYFPLTFCFKYFEFL